MQVYTCYPSNYASRAMSWLPAMYNWKRETITPTVLRHQPPLFSTCLLLILITHSTQLVTIKQFPILGARRAINGNEEGKFCFYFSRFLAFWSESTLQYGCMQNEMPSSVNFRQWTEGSKPFFNYSHKKTVENCKLKIYTLELGRPRSDCCTCLQIVDD